jgi:hypothetical protein
LRVVDDHGSFRPKEQAMQEVILKQRSSHSFNEVDRDTQLKQILDTLESENSQLKSLVVRLSETIIRNVSAKR